MCRQPRERVSIFITMNRTLKRLPRDLKKPQRSLNQEKEPMSLNDLFTEIIIDHYQHPHNHGVVENATQSSRGYNESCGDDIELTLLVKDGIIEEAKFSRSRMLDKPGISFDHDRPCKR